MLPSTASTKSCVAPKALAAVTGGISQGLGRGAVTLIVCQAAAQLYTPPSTYNDVLHR
jgi:hypothetical protein